MEEWLQRRYREQLALHGHRGQAESQRYTLTKAPDGTFERERLTEVAPIKSIRNGAEEQFRIPSECEIKVKPAQSSSSLQSSASTSEPRTSGPTPGHATWLPQELSEVKHDLSRLAGRERDHVPRDTNVGRASIAMGSSTLDMTDSGFERPKQSPTIGKLDDAPRSARSALDAHERGSFWLASHSSRPSPPESWLPSTPEEDTPMSHTFTDIARKGSAASASSFWAPSVLNIPSSTEPHDVNTNTKERGGDRISAMEQERGAICRPWDRRRTASYTYTEAQTSSSTFGRLGERFPPIHFSYFAEPSPPTAVPAARYSCSSGSLSSTVPTGYSNSSDSLSSTVPIGYSHSLPSTQVPIPSASKPIAIKKLFSLDDDSFQSSPSPKEWDVPSRSPYEPYHEFPDSPQTPDELPRSWPSSGLRTRLSSQDMRYGLYHTQHVHMYDGVHDDFDWYDERSIRQREESFRRREEEISLREQELKRREDVIWEEEVKQKEREEREAERVDDEIMCKELEIINQEEGAKTREAETEHEEAETKLKEKHAKTEGEKAEIKEVQDKRRVEDLRQREEPAARRLVEEESRMTRDVLRKSEEAKREEDEVRLKEEASRATEEKIRRKEEGLAQREGALLRREAEASRRHHQQKVQQEELRKRAEIRRQSVEEKTKQGWKFWGYNPPDPNRTTPPPRMSTSRSFSSSTGPGPSNRNERVLAASSPTNRGRSTSIGTSRSSTTRISLTRLSSTANSQRSSTPKTQMPSAQKNSPRQMPTSRSSSSMGPCPAPNSNELHMSAENLPTDRGRTSTSRRAATWTSSTRLSSTESLRPPSTPKPQTPSAHKNTPRQMSASRSPSSSARPWPIPNRNELHMPAANSHRGHSKSTNTSRSNTPWTSSTRLSSLPSAQSSSIPKPQKLSAQKSAPPRISSSRSVSSSTTKPWPIPSRNDLHMPATSLPTYNSRTKTTSTSRSTTWSYSTRPIPTSQPSSTPKSQTPPSQQNNKVPPGTILLNTSTLPLSETTATEEEASQELPGSASDFLEDLTNDLQGRSQYPTNFGGFGDIWKCDLVKAGEIVQVAAKTIRAFESDNEEMMRKNAKRVRRELKVWGRLKHDSILPLWGVANDFGPHPAMICPWADNGALTGFLERQQNVLSSQDKFSLLNDIALGLQYLHNESVVHGDLTGSNVLIYGNGRACLADFGLSTIILEFIGTSYFTSSIRGNVRWVAAELCEAPEDDEVLLSTECDIYSFGSITLQVLTCKVPYYNVKKDIVVLGQVIKGLKPEPPKESQIAPGHWEFIQQCWLPRASRPSVGEIVAFVECERQALPP